MVICDENSCISKGRQHDWQRALRSIIFGLKAHRRLQWSKGQERQRRCFSKPSVFGESAWLAAATSSSITTVQGHERISEGRERRTYHQQQHRRLPRKSTRHDLLEASNKTNRQRHISQRGEHPTSQHIHSQAKKNTYPLHGPHHHHPAPVLSTGYRAMHDVGSAEDSHPRDASKQPPPTSRRQKQAKARDSINRKAHFVDERARKSAAARQSIAASSP